MIERSDVRLIIAGGRDFVPNLSLHIGWLDSLPRPSEVVCGGAPGADTFGAYWAKLRGVAVQRFDAEWHVHGKAAGPIRNKQMAEYADAAALFPGGRGTDDMLRQAHAHGLQVYDWTAA